MRPRFPVREFALRHGAEVPAIAGSLRDPLKAVPEEAGEAPRGAGGEAGPANAD